MELVYLYCIKHAIILCAKTDFRNWLLKLNSVEKINHFFIELGAIFKTLCEIFHTLNSIQIINLDNNNLA